MYSQPLQSAPYKKFHQYDLNHTTLYECNCNFSINSFQVGSPELFESEDNKKNDTENHIAVSPVKAPGDEIDLDAPETNGEVNGAAGSSSDEEILRPVKRKGPVLNKKSTTNRNSVL